MIALSWRISVIIDSVPTLKEISPLHEIVLIRHGEAAKSATDPDPGLTALGQQQAQALVDDVGSRYPGGEGVRIISSPKSRTLQTALPLATHWGHEILQAPDVIEIPSPEGMPLAQRGDWIRHLLHSEWDSLSASQAHWRERLIAFLLSLDSHSGKMVSDSGGAFSDNAHTSLVFCHFMVINSVVAQLRGDRKITQFYPDYTSQTHLKLDNGTLSLVELGRALVPQGEHRIQ
ncbi:histidine phosphatase family protein [Microbulbifer sp. Q7]|uniref:histidine phosphatase family protein n=1 Tax=Microbulbifer sp. Q7 TaxID=1785091 RepID=UPI00082E08CA|nr:histidine phosphatase family protein [Microbulbifer sp. Q7]